MPGSISAGLYDIRRTAAVAMCYSPVAVKHSVMRSQRGWPAAFLLLALTAAPASSQTTTTITAPAAPPAAASEPGMDTAKLFSASAPGPDTLGRVITVDDAVEIALANVPDIAARLQDYAAARYRFKEALTAYLPQITASVGSQKNANSVVSATETRFVNSRAATNFAPYFPAFGSSGLTPDSTIRAVQQVDSSSTFSNNLLAQTPLSQLLFDFGKTAAAADSAKKLADIAQQSVELQKQVAVLAVREGYTNLLLSQRLVQVNLDAL